MSEIKDIRELTRAMNKLARAAQALNKTLSSVKTPRIVDLEPMCGRCAMGSHESGMVHNPLCVCCGSNHKQ